MAGLTITSAADRAKAPTSIKGLILGVSGVGKTSLARTLDPKTTLLIDAEAGTIALGAGQGQPLWDGDSFDLNDMSVQMNVHPWELCRLIALLVAGPDPAVKPEHIYSRETHARMVEMFSDFSASLAKYHTVMIDSLTVLSRYCFSWALTQPEAMSRTGVPDTRGAYGLLGQEMVKFLTRLQHAPGRNIWILGILQTHSDDVGRTYWGAQVEGKKTMSEVPGILDQVITMAEVDFGEHGKHRAFVCSSPNPYGYPAKDRSGTLQMIEEPHLGKLAAKITAARRVDAYATATPPIEEAVQN